MNGITILQGDALEVLRTLPDESVHCVVTSPPYWGLRDYGTATWDGGLPECGHLHKTGGTEKSTLGLASGGHNLSDEARVRSTTRSFVPYTHTCGKCGAVRIDRQIGLESTPQGYVERMVGVFAEARRVLRADGTLWLNMGDSYASDWPCNRRNVVGAGSLENGKRENRPPRLGDGLKPKDLVGMPWRLAFALQSDGWYLRSDIIWHKPNPMPESVTDRPTKAHEYIFLLSKSERYFYNGDEIKEPVSEATIERDAYPFNNLYGRARLADPKDKRVVGAKVGAKQDQVGKRQYTGFNGRWDEKEANGEAVRDRNKRSVWTVATQPFPEAHFATFPEELIKPCILAGCPAGGTVLDPFGGSGTTALVARANGCKAILIELNPKYIEIAKRRLAQEHLEFV